MHSSAAFVSVSYAMCSGPAARDVWRPHSLLGRYRPDEHPPVLNALRLVNEIVACESATGQCRWVRQPWPAGRCRARGYHRCAVACIDGDLEPPVNAEGRC